MKLLHFFWIKAKKSVLKDHFRQFLASSKRLPKDLYLKYLGLYVIEICKAYIQIQIKHNHVYYLTPNFIR